jgi:hypothetical protein
MTPTRAIMVGPLCSTTRSIALARVGRTAAMAAGRVSRERGPLPHPIQSGVSGESAPFFHSFFKFEARMYASAVWAAEFAETAMRYLIRQGRPILSTWMVWDRVKRRPAVVDGRELVGLSREEAEAAHGRLIGRNSGGDKRPASTGWRVFYSGILVNCRDEEDAKSLARELIKRRFRVSAETAEGVLPAQRIEPTQMKQWLAD